MLHLPPNLLAASDEGPMRFIGILIFIAIVVIGNLLQWLQKRQEQKRLEERRRMVNQQAAPPMPQRPMAGRPLPQQAGQRMRPQPVQRRIPAPVPIQRKPQPRPQPPKRVLQVPPRLPPLPGRPARQLEIPRPAPAPVEQSVATTRVGAKPPSESAARQSQFLKAILNPRLLRQAFILTEIVQPPVALRDPGAPNR